MARINEKSKSGISGIIGNAVFTIDGNVRIRPKKRQANGWTSDQKAQRDRMKSVAELYRKAKYPIVEYVWLKTMPSRREAYKNFVKYNMQAFDRDGMLADPLMLKMAVGELKLPYKMGAVVSQSGNRVIDVSWENNLPEGWEGCNDSLMGILFNGKSFSLPLDFKACRKDNHAELCCPADCVEQCYLYLFFVNNDKTSISNSFSVRL